MLALELVLEDCLFPAEYLQYCLESAADVAIGRRQGGYHSKVQLVVLVAPAAQVFQDLAVVVLGEVIERVVGFQDPFQVLVVAVRNSIHSAV